MAFAIRRPCALRARRFAFTLARTVKRVPPFRARCARGPSRSLPFLALGDTCPVAAGEAFVAGAVAVAQAIEGAVRCSARRERRLAGGQPGQRGQDDEQSPHSNLHRTSSGRCRSFIESPAT
ncbi:MAG TPA: hypothetical protein QGF58_29810, partial [Myxococcota bacterium]|nr:hypothetical protein [Myxococcota bacterium]